MTTATSPFIIGWLEWLALPELGLPAIKAKIDTGARTSALHAFQIETFGNSRLLKVRFGVNPIPGLLDVAVFCSAPVVDRREVMSSNGEREVRIFISTLVSLGGRTWPIEIGLTNRESMAYRMLLGRQAIREDMMVDVAASFRQPRLSYKLYRGVPRQSGPVARSLRIALVARGVDAPFNRRLARVAAARGHELELLELDRLAITFDDDSPGLSLDGAALAHYDAVIPRLGRGEGAAGAAIVRQLESMGSLSLVPGDAIDRVANRLATAQALARERIPQMLLPEASMSPERETSGCMLRVLVVGDNAIAIISVAGERQIKASLARHRTERRLAEHAAAASGLGLASVDIDYSKERAVVVRLSARPALGRFARLGDADVASEIIDVVETRLRLGIGGRQALPAEA